MTVLGLDISTSCTGVVVLGEERILEYIEFKGKNTVWEKADHVSEWLEEKSVFWPEISSIYVEDPAKKFTAGQSSANTIVSLAKFNGLVSYIFRNKFKLDPVYIAATAARKACGMKMQQKKLCGKSHKEQVIEHMLANDLKDIVWPTKKSGKPVDWQGDVVDAYTMAKAGYILYGK